MKKKTKHPPKVLRGRDGHAWEAKRDEHGNIVLTDVIATKQGDRRQRLATIEDGLFRAACGALVGLDELVAVLRIAGYSPTYLCPRRNPPSILHGSSGGAWKASYNGEIPGPNVTLTITRSNQHRTSEKRVAAITWGTWGWLRTARGAAIPLHQLAAMLRVSGYNPNRNRYA